MRVKRTHLSWQICDPTRRSPTKRQLVAHTLARVRVFEPIDMLRSSCSSSSGIVAAAGGGGRHYWARNDEITRAEVKGIVVIFAWVSITESQLTNYVNLYASLGWDSLVCIADFLNPFVPEKATALAFSLLNELAEELRRRPCPLVLASFSGGSKACLYKFFQIIGGCEGQLNLEDSQLVASCISGHIYDSSPVDFASDLGARFALHPTILKMPGSGKLVSLVARGVSSGLDALFLTKFGSQRTEYWQNLYSSVSLGAPFLILCSESDNLAPYPVICNFAQRLQHLGGNVKLVKWINSPHVDHLRSYPYEYKAAVTELFEQSVLVFTHKIQKLRETTGMDYKHDEISNLICDLQNAAVDSTESLRRVALGPNDHFFMPSSVDDQNDKDSGILQEERKERSPYRPNPSMSAHSVLGQILFDACVPKNIEGWDIRFSGSLNGQPFASACKYSGLNAIKRIGRSRL